MFWVRIRGPEFLETANLGTPQMGREAKCRGRVHVAVGGLD